MHSRRNPVTLSLQLHALVTAYREYGHLAADIDPLGLLPRDTSNLELDRFGLGDTDVDVLVHWPPWP